VAGRRGTGPAPVVEMAMSRRQVDPLRTLTPEERAELERLGRATAEPAGLVARAKALLGVAGGLSYTVTAPCRVRRSGDGVTKLVGQFNREGLVALMTRHGGGPVPTYTAVGRRASWPRRAGRQTARTMGRRSGRSPRCDALRQAPDGLPAVSTYTIWEVLREAGWSW